MSLYEAQKAKFEENFCRAELDPRPGGWWLDTVNGRYAPTEGACCAMSPSAIGLPSLGAMGIHEALAEAYGVTIAWVDGAIGGFDCEKGSTLDGSQNPSEYEDGYAWGQYMRAKYVRTAVPA